MKTKYNISYHYGMDKTPRCAVLNVKQYLASIGRKGGQAKSPAKTAAARKANAARWQGHTPKTRPAKPRRFRRI